MGARTAAYDATGGRCGARPMISVSSDPRPCSSTTRGAAGSLAPYVSTTGAGKLTRVRLEGQLPSARGAEVQGHFGRTTDGLGDLDALHGVSLRPGPWTSYRSTRTPLEEDDPEGGSKGVKPVAPA